MVTNAEEVNKIAALFKGDANEQIDQTEKTQTDVWLLTQETNQKILEAQQALSEPAVEQQTPSDSPSPTTQVIDEVKRETKLAAVEKTAEKIQEAVKEHSPTVVKAEMKFADELLKDAKALLKEGEKAVKDVLSSVVSKIGGK